MGLLATSFTNFFRSLLPAYIIREDSYKDNTDKGLIERYMMLFGDYIDSDISQEVEEFLNIIDASVCAPEYLNHISDVLGNPPDVFQDEEQYRNLLAYIVSVYKIKGTVRAYELFFSILGFITEIEEIPPINDTTQYDEAGIYDNNNLYDANICQPCSAYTIKFYYRNNNEAIDLDTFRLLRAAIEFNEPINAQLASLTMVLNIEDTIAIDITDRKVNHETEPIPFYDSAHEYDDETLPLPPVALFMEIDFLPDFMTYNSLVNENDVATWNTFFGSAFSMVEVMGNNITLRGGSNSITLINKNMGITLKAISVLNQTSFISMILQGTGITSFPNLTGTNNITQLKIDGNRIEDTGVGLNGKTQLEYLDVSSNLLTTAAFEGILSWAMDDAPYNGTYNTEDNPQDLLTTMVIDKLTTTKAWNHEI